MTDTLQTDLAAEVARLREHLLDLGNALAVLAAEHADIRAQVHALRTALTAAHAYAGLPFPADLAAALDGGLDRVPQPGAQDHAHADPVALKVQHGPSAALPPQGSYEAVAAVQGRRRQMHVIAGGEASR